MCRLCLPPFVRGPIGRAILVVAAAAAPAAAQEGETTISHGISPFGELNYPPDFPHFDYVNPDAPIGGTMSFRGTGASQTFDSLNPFILAGEPAQGLGLTYDSLLETSDDEPGAAYGQIAESIEYPADRSWAIFNMRPEARFSDGEPITADDVVFSLEAIKEMGAPRYQITYRDIEGAEALGEHRVKFNFAEGAETRDLPALAGDLDILPRHYYETVPFDRSTLEPPVSSGEYVVEDVRPGRSITYCRNPDYWAEDLPVNVGRDNFECYRYEYFADNTAAFEAFKVGEYLFHEEYTSATWATEYDFPALRAGHVVRETLPDARPSGTQGFWMNMRREKLQDPRVREAIAMMFNFEWTNATLFHGLYQRTDSFWENSPMQAEGVPQGAELALLEEFRDELPPEIFTEPAYTPPEGSTQQVDRSALRAASRLLDEAGWTVGDDGIRRNAEGERLSVAILDDNPVFERVILPYIANLERIGIDARFDLVDAAQYQQRQKDFEYDIVPARFVLPLTPSSELRSLFSSDSATQPGTFNLSGVADPVVDALIERILGASSRDELNVRVRALDRVLRAKQIWVPNWHKGSHFVAFWDVFGRPETKPPYARGDNYWWFDQDRHDALRSVGALR